MCTVDNDCDVMIDEEDTDVVTYYLDNDGDGYGDARSTCASAYQPSDAWRCSDCDDGDATQNPSKNVVR